MNDVSALHAAAKQDQFLDVVSREEAEARWHAHLALAPLGTETIPLARARTRILAHDVLATVDVPGFDRASVDGFAVRSEDTEGASPSAPAILRLTNDLLTPGTAPATTIEAGWASVIATGGMLPRGADAVVMVEHTERLDGEALRIEIHRPAAPGAFVAGAGSDIALGETVLRRGRQLTSREIAMLAAIGLGEVPVWRRPRVAILSTGDEIIAPGAPIQPGQVFDSNAATLAAAVEEQGGEAIALGIVPDDPAQLEAALAHALAIADIVLLSGGTSKGAGDLASRAAARLDNPGIVVHGVALKPGKPLCLAVQDGKPVAILPGFPTSAIFTFHTFVAPIIRVLAGLPPTRQQTIEATLPLRIGSERGRTEYVLSALVPSPDGSLAAYPTAKGSGAVTSFASADGFFTVPANTETVAAGTRVTVQRIGDAPTPDLVVIGSHCTGLDLLVGLLEQDGLVVRTLAVGSQGGLNAAARGACDLAGIHLMDPATGIYNRPLLPPGVALIPGYGRLQGIVIRPDDARFAGCTTPEDVAGLDDPTILMINRNQGSGTRVLIDRLLIALPEGRRRPAGFAHAPKSHNAVAAAVAQSRADWGVAIQTVARDYGLRFLPLQAEQYDFAIPETRLGRAAVQRFIALLQAPATRDALRAKGFEA
jgi:putative molybdopterin biosynthesis protein